MKRIMRFLNQHPLTRGTPLRSALRVARWQVHCRLQDEVEFDWIDGAKLAVRRGMTGATGNIYAGLHEFGDMAFLLHLLRPGDLFVDVGANIGSYSVLAGKVCGAHVIAVDPDPESQKALHRNLRLNGLEAKVRVEGVAAGAEAGTVRFTVGLDTVNMVLTDSVTQGGREVPQRRLDDIVGDRSPTLIKLDVEGYEAQALQGAERVLQDAKLLAIETELDDARVKGMLEGAGFERVYYEPFGRTFCSEARSMAANSLYIRDRQACLARCATAAKRSILGREI